MDKTSKKLDELLVNVMVQQMLLTYFLEDYVNRMPDPLQALDAAQLAIGKSKIRLVSPQSGRSELLEEKNQAEIHRRAFEWLESYRKAAEKRISERGTKH